MFNFFPCMIIKSVYTFYTHLCICLLLVNKLKYDIIKILIVNEINKEKILKDFSYD